MASIDTTGLSAGCAVCPRLLEAADKFLKNSDRRVFDLAEKALLHLSDWLSLNEDDKGGLFPEIREGALCIVNNCGTGSEQSILSFAQKTLFARHLEDLKTDPRMRMEWYFSNLSRKLSAGNPFSNYLEIGLDQFLPFDIGTTCGELKSKKAVPFGEIRQGSAVFRVNCEAMAAFLRYSLLPVSFLIASHEYEVRVKDSEVSEEADLLPQSFLPDLHGTSLKDDAEESERGAGSKGDLLYSSFRSVHIPVKRRGAISPMSFEKEDAIQD